MRERPTEGSFVSSCSFSHRAPDDPIVFPRHPRWSHDHTFVGNVSTSAFSTLSSLRTAGTTCDRKADTAAYWAPTLLINGRPFLPPAATIYYRRKTLARVRPFPPGLKMIAGNSRATSPQSPKVTFWACGVIKSTFYSYNPFRPSAGSVSYSSGPSGVPRCPPPARLELHVNFPDCWSGKRLDSPDHKSHMAYSAGGKCAPAHPVAMPAISLVYSYPTIPPGPVVVLSSGGRYSGHADFINAWDQSTLRKLVANCLNALRACGPGA
jgi:Domain of unknown function (DUF1996)